MCLVFPQTKSEPAVFVAELSIVIQSCYKQKYVEFNYWAVEKLILRTTDTQTQAINCYS